jgi:large subunit ribosomal protein L22
MLVKAEQKFLRMSPRKLRLVASVVKKGSRPQDILTILEHIEKRAAKPLAKVIKQAVSNATNNLGISADSLRIKEIQIGEGPIYKRWRPVSRGRLHPIAKRTSHIKVFLETKEEEKKNGTKG